MVTRVRQPASGHGGKRLLYMLCTGLQGRALEEQSGMGMARERWVSVLGGGRVGGWISGFSAGLDYGLLLNYCRTCNFDLQSYVDSGTGGGSCWQWR